MKKIAAIQMTSSHIVTANLLKAAILIEQAAQAGAKLVVLPEMFAIMGHGKANKVSAKEAYGKGPIQDFLSSQAKQYGIWIVGGTIPIECDKLNKVRAACLVYDELGQVVARYDKIHLFDVELGSESHKESATTEPGDKAVVIDSPVGKLGLAVCYDIRFPVLFQKLYDLGAEVIVVPTAFTVPTGKAHWEVLTRARAIEGFVYIVGACQTGTHSSGRATYGHSIVVEPWGSVAQCLPEGEGILLEDINTAQVYAMRQRIPALIHRKAIK